jgi:small subunit ribosomal protein S4
MARYIQARCRRCRGVNKKLFLKGARCLSLKCPIDKKDSMVRKGPPGKMPGSRMKKMSGYGIQLKEKEKVKNIYGVLEKQFRRYFHIASRQKGITGENLIRVLETRLDNIIYRMHFASSRSQARQVILHGHIEVNGKKVDIPSFNVKINDIITLKEKSKNMKVIMESLRLSGNYGFSPWLEVDTENMRGTVRQIPRRADVTDLTDINEQLIVELYSK